MAKKSPNDSIHKKFCRNLAPEERMLITLRDELYDGSWENMKDDLNGRLDGRPYIFKLVNRIRDDLNRMKRLREFC